MEFINGFFEVWSSLNLPSWETIGNVIGIWSVLMMATIVLVTGLCVLTEAWGAFKRDILTRRLFIPNSQPPQ